MTSGIDHSTEDEGMGTPDRVLLLGDVDAIKEYVFETSSLPQIRGGSQLLIDCEDQVRNEVAAAGGQEIYCSGGSFLFEVPRAQARRIQQAIERLYWEQTGLATVTVVSEEALPARPAASPADGWASRLATAAARQTPLDGSFPHRVSLLHTELRRAKSQKATAPSYEALPFMQRCQTCGKRPAEGEIQRREPNGRGPVERQAVCGVCQRRHQAGLLGAGPARGQWNAEFQKRFQPPARQAPDLDHLVKRAKRGYLACLYADGNDIGGLLLRAGTSERYRALSKALREATRGALFTALATVCRAELEQGDSWPFEIVSVGGDDVLVLLQAGYAWEVAVHFLEAFEAEVRRTVRAALGAWPGDWPEQVTASCGLALADSRYPIRSLQALAEDLLRSAKGVARPATPTSALDFLWLVNPVLSDRAEPLKARYQGEGFVLTARPYRLEQAQRLLDLAAEAAQWPRTQRHLWGEALERGVLVSLNTIYYAVARRPVGERARLYAFLTSVGQVGDGAPHDTDGPALWRTDPKDPGRFRTALLDVLELAELHALRPGVREESEVLR